MAEGYSSKNSVPRSDSSSTNQRGQNSRFSFATNHNGETQNHPTQNIRRGPRNRMNSHTLSDQRQRPVCRFYKLGLCQYGERCRFAHVDVVPTTNIIEQHQSASSSTSPDKPENSENALYDKWLEAPEFVPSASKAKMKSYAEVVNPTTAKDDEEKANLKLCPYAEMHGVCSYADGECTYLHGNMCDLCGNAAMHPYNKEKQKAHTQECIKQHERNMELSFAVARSKEKSCGVCFEVIMEKSTREQRFGILPNCNHCFCLSCIRKWRQAKQFDNKIIRACPECRVTSDFVCPSMYWVDTKEEKEKLIKDYKCALSQKNCKYFKQGRGKCPFGNKCFYLHALPDGTKTDVGPPPRQPRRQNHEGEIDVLQGTILRVIALLREDRAKAAVKLARSTSPRRIPLPPTQTEREEARRYDTDRWYYRNLSGEDCMIEDTRKAKKKLSEIWEDKYNSNDGMLLPISMLAMYRCATNNMSEPLDEDFSSWPHDEELEAIVTSVIPSDDEPLTTPNTMQFASRLRELIVLRPEQFQALQEHEDIGDLLDGIIVTDREEFRRRNRDQLCFEHWFV